MNYESWNRLRKLKRITKVETDYEGQNELCNYVSIREIILYLLNIIYTHYKLKKNKKKKINGLFIQIKKKQKKKEN